MSLTFYLLQVVSLRKICVNVCLVSKRNFKVKRSTTLSRAEFRLAEVKFRWVFEKAPIKGCLQAFEEISQKDTKVLPQAKCRGTNLYSHSRSEKFFGGWGLSFKKVPASPVISRRISVLPSCLTRLPGEAFTVVRECPRRPSRGDSRAPPDARRASSSA